MPHFRLRHLRFDFSVPPGELLVGRSPECGLVLMDDLVSRRHAVFRASETQLTVEDLGSRNGVAVNGKLIHGRVALADGDEVTIGQQSLRVSVAQKAPVLPRRRSVPTLTGTMSNDRPTALGPRGAMIDKAFAAHKLVEVEFLLAPFVDGVMAEAQAGRVDAAALAEVTGYALRLAGESGKPMWLDRVFQLYLAAGRVMPIATVDELHALVRKVRYGYTSALRAYHAWLQGRLVALNPTERFTLQRIEGLIRVLRA